MVIAIATGRLLDGFALLLLDLLGDLVAELLGHPFTLLDRRVVALLPHRRHAAGNQFLDVSAFAHTARHLTALLSVDVFLDLLGLLALLQFANLLVLVMAHLLLGRKRNLLRQLLTMLFLPDLALLGRHSTWSGVAFGILTALALGLLLTAISS